MLLTTFPILRSEEINFTLKKHWTLNSKRSDLTSIFYVESNISFSVERNQKIIYPTKLPATMRIEIENVRQTHVPVHSQVIWRYCHPSIARLHLIMQNLVKFIFDWTGEAFKFSTNVSICFDAPLRNVWFYLRERFDIKIIWFLVNRKFASKWRFILFCGKPAIDFNFNNECGETKEYLKSKLNFIIINYVIKGIFGLKKAFIILKKTLKGFHFVRLDIWNCLGLSRLITEVKQRLTCIFGWGPSY